MTSRVSGGRPVAWEDAGRQIASMLGSYSAVVVTSSDPVAAAHVALGIARSESTHRRVVVGDLVGDIPALRSLVIEEDPHGITDSFLYGVSFNKIGYPVEGTANLYVMPSGGDRLIHKEILHSTRWTKLATGFRDESALLLLVAPADSQGLAELIDQVDGVVLVKDSDLPAAPSALVLARVASPTPTLKIPLHNISARAASWRARVGDWRARAAGLRARAATWRQHKWFYPALGAIALVLVASVGAALMFIRLGRPAPPQAPVVVVNPVRVPAPTPPPPRPPPETLQVAPATNLSDSASAPAFTVELLVANTPEGANLFVRKNGAALPAAAVSPVPIDPERTVWYKVTAGAYTSKYQADSLLFALRKSGVLKENAGSVTTTPLALLVDSVPSQGGIGDAVRAAVQKYADRGLQVYALMQDDGGALLYSGAFAAADQPAGLVRTLRGAGLKPVLVYRTGRAP